MRIFVLAVLGVCSLLVNCGSSPDPSPPFSDNGGAGGGTANGGSGGSGGGGFTSPCQTYCDHITTNGADCGTYNDQGRCKANCSKYSTGPCPKEWGAFQQCVLQSPQLSCFQPEGSNVVLVTVGCQAEYETWNTCQKEHDAGCPEAGI
ncbi:MAG: hypothetical protein HY898_21480 [Deltaproteobacteria bacterium]|nr:hypothetical protein [Deltaproteobacteria bacterium]